MRSAAVRQGSLRGVWLVLALPPFAFLLVIIVASVAIGASGRKDPGDIARAVADATPWLLLTVQLVLVALAVTVLRSEGHSWHDLPWRPPDGRPLRNEAAVGAVTGVVLAACYLTGLSPLMIWAQRTVGDYVPAGELLPSLGTALLPFFVANVVLAPLAEEALYRGYALPRLLGRYRAPAAIAISCTGFGLLHWSGGWWYLLLTGTVAGGTFAALFTWRRNLVAAYAAHLALNAVEFGYVAWAVHS